MTAGSYDVAVIGGGAIGSATARELARRGARVVVIERDTPGRAATWAAGGMLSPLAEAAEPGRFLDFVLASLERFPGLVESLREETGLEIEYRDNGKLLVALDDEELSRLEAGYAWRRETGQPVTWLDAGDARRLEPSLSPETRAAILLGNDHRLDNRQFGHALWLAAERAGVEFRLGAPALRVDRSADGARVTGVTLLDGETIVAGAVVVAAGAWSAQIDGLPRRLPMIPVRGQIIALRAVPPLIDHVVLGAGAYLIPRGNGQVLVGATAERAGFRIECTAGGISRLLGSALSLLPGLEDAPVVETWAGLRPGTPDERPILGPDPEVSGLFYATGHYRNGILLTPITAELVAAAVLGAAPADAFDGFAPDRFNEAVVA